MPKTYTDIVNAMIEAREQGLSVDRLVITDATMDTFLSDDQFTKADEERQKETIGTDWELRVESGDDNYLLTESGEQFPL